VADNVDAIHDRLPKPLRTPRRRFRLIVRWAGSIGIPALVIVALSGVQKWPSALTGRTGAVAAPVPPGPPDTSAMGQRFPPGVLALAVRRVIVDAGHGGEYLGTSSASGLREKDLTLDIASRLRPLLVARGFEVVLTRTEDHDLSLQQRAEIANGARGDVFVSIHLNSFQPASVKGIETYYLGPSAVPEVDALAAKENQHAGYSLADLRTLLDQIFTDARRSESKRLAEDVQRALMGGLGPLEPDLADRGVKMSPFVVLIATEMPAILAEVSYLSNGDEAKRLAAPEYRQTIAEALATGIATFAQNSRVSTDRKDKDSGR
jgi:N-acetylmuramoyl-L-alanine amidase